MVRRSFAQLSPLALVVLLVVVLVVTCELRRQASWGEELLGGGRKVDCFGPIFASREGDGWRAGDG